MLCVRKVQRFCPMAIAATSSVPASIPDFAAEGDRELHPDLLFGQLLDLDPPDEIGPGRVEGRIGLAAFGVRDREFDRAAALVDLLEELSPIMRSAS